MKPEVNSPLGNTCMVSRVPLLACPAVFLPEVSPYTAGQASSGTLRQRAAKASLHVSASVALLVPLVLTAVFAPVAVAKERVRLECTPRTFRVVPGEPMRLELTVRADSAASLRLHVPGDPLLKLRALEKLPVRRTPEGVIIYKRVVVWQALEPGLVKIDKLSVETKGRKLLFPEVTITVRDPGP